MQVWKSILLIVQLNKQKLYSSPSPTKKRMKYTKDLSNNKIGKSCVVSSSSYKRRTAKKSKKKDMFYDTQTLNK